MPRTKKEIREETMRELMRRAEKGAAFMDTSLPKWHQQIDINRLNLRWSDDCILGQCFKNYNQAVKTLKLSHDAQVQLGFFLCWGIINRKYPMLTECWKTLINQRLANDEQKTQTAALPTPSENTPQQNHPTTNTV